ncbi:small ribosomal subunit protein uS11m isoform X2 [Dasypus novemcinctus]|uniref:small ribosomal subunit protein uS11m isoform X2 n=1 Tax=Dasypus novemcinctus TaxID=9361 RepID=UPI00265F8A1D|nr:small ribosomal subunit protein uS11m isoform X2 [Dasypus novemcinctus]
MVLATLHLCWPPDGSRLGSVPDMQAVRKAGSCLLRSWVCPRTISIYPPLPGEEGSLRWAGKKFEEIPIAHIKATYNNTHIQVVSATNQPLSHASCGTEGFRNAKKGTGVAAQTAGIAAAARATGKGVTHVRVVVKGLGPGRLSAIKGLTMGGLEVISITDNTPIPHNGCRPRKARRL